MINITLKQLRYFEALTQHKHFGRAAEVCAISQPALSMQIKELEETLGVPLLERSARKVQLTQFGEMMAVRAKDILRAVGELEDVARAAQKTFVGRLRIGVIPTVAPYLLPKAISTLSSCFPDIDLHIRETVTPRLVDELHAGLLDAAILALPTSAPSLIERELFRENFVFVSPPEEPFKSPPTAESIKEMRLLLLEEGHCFRDQALAFCNLTSHPSKGILDATSLSTLVQMVSAGMGVTLLPEMAVEVETKSAEVSVAHFTSPKPQRTIGMTWRRSSPLKKQLDEIASTLSKTFI